VLPSNVRIPMTASAVGSRVGLSPTYSNVNPVAVPAVSRAAAIASRSASVGATVVSIW
jgi:hypothetical protein